MQLVFLPDQQIQFQLPVHTPVIPAKTYHIAQVLKTKSKAPSPGGLIQITSYAGSRRFTSVNNSSAVGHNRVFSKIASICLLMPAQSGLVCIPGE